MRKLLIFFYQSTGTYFFDKQFALSVWTFVWRSCKRQYFLKRLILQSKIAMETFVICTIYWWCLLVVVHFNLEKNMFPQKLWYCIMWSILAHWWASTWNSNHTGWPDLAWGSRWPVAVASTDVQSWLSQVAIKKRRYTFLANSYCLRP